MAGVVPPSWPTTGPVRPSGVTARELILRTGHAGKIANDELERWLLDSGLAERDGGPGLLPPTRRAFELGGSLAFLG